jgi:hypothetical protein
MEANGTLFDVILHEMGHVLGIGTLWEARGLLIGKGGADPCFIGPSATAAYNSIFGQTASCVPVANEGAPVSRDGHWRDSLFGNELMSPNVSPPGTSNPQFGDPWRLSAAALMRGARAHLFRAGFR